MEPNGTHQGFKLRIARHIIRDYSFKRIANLNWEAKMKAIAASVVLSMLVLSPALANPVGIPNGGVGNGNGNGNGNQTHVQGAPGPLVGAGIPALAIGLGYGAYWLVRRRRNAS
jgi:hypothetical protein